MRMPYGKFKGVDIDQLPSGYLRWVAENWKEDTPQNKAICRAADAEYSDREKTGAHFNDVKKDVGFKCPHCGGFIEEIP